jgi:hypothetical protein
MASKFSHEIGLKKIQEILNDYGFYDAAHGAEFGSASITAKTRSATAIRSPIIPMPRRCGSSCAGG